jgi:hypothetical protein
MISGGEEVFGVRYIHVDKRGLGERERPEEAFGGFLGSKQSAV